MANQISNIGEESLLVWLSNSLESTQKHLDSQIESKEYWESSEQDVKDIIHQIELVIKSLSYRLEWIQLQIENVKFSQKFETIRK